MSVIDGLATSLKRRDEEPNIAVAEKIAKKNDKQGVAELMELLHKKDKNIQHDCIKALYEVGRLKPALIAPYKKEFLALLKSKNNRLQWGAMTALGTLTAEDPKGMYGVLPQIMDAAEKGSVITRDHCVNILLGLYAVKDYSKKVFPLFIEILLSCPVNQLAMYADNALPVINAGDKKQFGEALYTRLPDIEKDTMRKRIDKVLKKL
jgi:hypothetical protein